MRSALVAQLAAPSDTAIPLLVVRLPALERTAWREGLRKARSLEKRACAAFVAAAARTLRADDSIAHDPGSDIFLAALTAPTRDAPAPDRTVDARSALARISATMESATRLDVESGWTTYTAADEPDIAAVVERGLRRGAQERERYAFFSAIGHELRTPLASIRGYLETLQDEAIDDRTRSRFLAIAYTESLRLSRLVEGMFEISLLDLHTAPAAAACASGSLDAALEAAADACAGFAASRGMRVSRSPCARTFVRIDGDRLTLVLINVIENAIKHGRTGGTVTIAADLRDPQIATVTIDDDGPGVAPADRERVFAFGERGTTPAHGSGIGLALVRLLVERAGGRVEITDSSLGGARLFIDLPRATPHRPSGLNLKRDV